jgi:hypothetical protein
MAACLVSGFRWEFSKATFYFFKEYDCLLCNLPSKVCLEICDRKFIQPQFLLRHVEEMCCCQSE